jgi:hypothetical protein
MRAHPVQVRALRRAIVLAVLVVGAIAASAGPAAASGMTVIDSFTSGSGSWSTCGNSLFVYQQDASILGGARELALRDAGSCHYGPNPAQMSIDAAHGTASWGGPNTYSPEQHFSYGTEIGTWANVSWSPNPNGGKGTPLHLSLTLTDAVVIDMQQVNSPFMQIRLRDGHNQVHYANASLVVGTNLVPLSAFSGLTAAAAGDIDGISFSGSNKNPTDVVSEFAIKAADSDPPVAAPTESPAANGSGWNNSDVTVSWNWSDSGSGVDWSNCTPSSTSTSEGAIALSATCQDNAGNQGFASVTVNVDKTAPIVAFSPDGQTYDVNDTVSIACSATDELSGVASSTCADVSGPAWSLGVGTHDLTATATDNAGNTGTASGSYTVKATANGACALVNQWLSKAGVASSLCAKLQAAGASRARGDDNAADNQLAAFRNALDAQTGKSISADHAATLASLSRAL